MVTDFFGGVAQVEVLPSIEAHPSIAASTLDSSGSHLRVNNSDPAYTMTNHSSSVGHTPHWVHSSGENEWLDMQTEIDPTIALLLTSTPELGETTRQARTWVSTILVVILVGLVMTRSQKARS